MGQLQAQFDPAAQTLTLGPDPSLSCGSGFLCPCPFQASISSGLCSLKQILFSKQFRPTAHPESTVQATGMGCSSVHRPESRDLPWAWGVESASHRPHGQSAGWDPGEPEEGRSSGLPAVSPGFPWSRRPGL